MCSYCVFLRNYDSITTVGLTLWKKRHKQAHRSQSGFNNLQAINLLTNMYHHLSNRC